MKKICLIGPVAPFRGGIAQHLTLFDQNLRQTEADVLLISFKRQYPRLLFGREDKDPASQPPHAQAEYLIDSLNPFSWVTTVRRILAWQPDAVIIPWWTPFWAPLWTFCCWRLKKRLPQIKLIFLCHNVLPHEPRFFDTAALRFTLSWGDGFIVHAKAEEDKLLAQFPQARVLVTPLPTYSKVGQDYESQLAHVPSVSAENVLLFFGIIRHYKGLDVLLNALPKVHSSVHLFIVGDFWESEEAYQDQIQRLNLSDQVTLINRYVPDDLLAAYIHTADVVVLPYRSATQSAVVQMALGHGTPVITTNVGGLAEAVADKQTGLIGPPENSSALANAIDTFFQNPDQIDFQANIQKTRQQFSWETFTDNVLKFGLKI